MGHTNTHLIDRSRNFPRKISEMHENMASQRGDFCLFSTCFFNYWFGPLSKICGSFLKEKKIVYEIIYLTKLNFFKMHQLGLCWKPTNWYLVTATKQQSQLKKLKQVEKILMVTKNLISSVGVIWLASNVPCRL